MILHKFPGGDGHPSISPPCVKIELALNRIGKPYESVYHTSRAKVRKVSPTGRLPVLEIEGERIADSIAIMDSLERRFPGAGLAPADPRERVVDRLWEHFANDHLYWIGFYLRWIDPDGRERFAAALFGRAPILIRLLGKPIVLRQSNQRAQAVGVHGKSPAEVALLQERAFEMVAAGLDGGPFLGGRTSPGRGDMALATLLAASGFRGTLPAAEKRMRDRPALVEYVKAVYRECSTDLPNWLS